MAYPSNHWNQYIQPEDMGLPNPQALPPVVPKNQRRNVFGGPPGHDPTVSLTLQSPRRTDKANVFLRVRNTAEGGQAWAVEDPQARRTSQKYQKVLTMTSQGYVTTDCCCLEMNLHADTQQQKKGRPKGAKNKKTAARETSTAPQYANLSTSYSSNSSDGDGGSQTPASSIQHTAALVPPLATPVTQSTSHLEGYKRIEEFSREQLRQYLEGKYYGGDSTPLNAYTYNGGNSNSSNSHAYQNQAPVNFTGSQSYSSSSSSNSHSYQNQAPVNFTGSQSYSSSSSSNSHSYQNQPSVNLTESQPYSNSSSSDSHSYPTQPPANPNGYQSYNPPAPTFSYGYKAPSSSTIATNVQRLRTQSPLESNAPAAAQDNSPSPVNPRARPNDYSKYPDPNLPNASPATPYYITTPAIPQGCNARNTPIDTNIERLRTQSPLEPSAPAAVQDNFPSPVNALAQNNGLDYTPDATPPSQERGAMSMFDFEKYLTVCLLSLSTFSLYRC